VGLGAQRPVAEAAANKPLVASFRRVILRCTARLLAFAGRPDPRADPGPCEEDWYANLLWIERRKCLLATHAATLFSVFSPDVRAAQVRALGSYLAGRIAAELAAAGLPADALGELDGDHVTIAKTADRSVLGCMRDLALSCELAVADAGGMAALDLDELHRHLRQHLSAARGYVPPVDLAADFAARRRSG